MKNHKHRWQKLEEPHKAIFEKRPGGEQFACAAEIQRCLTEPPCHEVFVIPLNKELSSVMGVEV